MAISFNWASVTYKPNGFSIPATGSSHISAVEVEVTDYIQCQSPNHSKDYLGVNIGLPGGTASYTAWGPIGRALQYRRQKSRAEVYAVIQSKLNEGKYTSMKFPLARKYALSVGKKLEKLVTEEPMFYDYGEMVKRTIANWVNAASDPNGEDFNFEELYAEDIALRFTRVREYLSSYADLEYITQLQEKSSASVTDRAKLLMSESFKIFEDDDLWYSWKGLLVLKRSVTTEVFSSYMGQLSFTVESLSRFGALDIIHELLSGRLVTLKEFQRLHIALEGTNVKVPWEVKGGE